MQSISVYLYPNKIDVYTNASAAWKTERYRRVYNRNLKIYRGVDNRIDIQVRNSDEKAADITGSTMVFNLVERESQQLVATKDCTVVNSATGKFYVVLSESDIGNISTGFYEYSVNAETRTDNGDGTHYVTERNPMYIDSQYGTRATVEILASGYSEPKPSTIVKTFSLHESFGEPFDNYYISSAINARPERTSSNSLHTFQFYCTGYTGDVIIQASLSDSATPLDWIDIETVSLSDSTVSYQNIIGKYNWFRVKHIPNPDIESNGTFDKLLYR